MPILHNQSWDIHGNLVSEEWVEIPDPEVDVQALAETLATLPAETLQALKTALGLQ